MRRGASWLPSGYRWNDGNHVRVFDGRFLLLKETHIFVVQEDIHEAAYFSLLVHDAFGEAGIGSVKFVENVTEGGADCGHLLLIVGELPERGWNADGCHSLGISGWVLLGGCGFLRVTKFQNFGFEILFGDLAGGGPATLFIDGIDPDWFAGSMARFIAVGLVEDAETTRFPLFSDAPGLAEWLKGLETPSRGRDGTEGDVFAHDGLWVVDWLGVVTPRNEKTADSYQEAAVGSGRRFCSAGCLPRRTSDELPHPATLGYVSSQVGIPRLRGGIPDV